jgi:hypothetical protein
MVLNVFKLTLATLGKGGNNIPGLKLALEWLLNVIERVQVCYKYLTSMCFEQTRLLYRKPWIMTKVLAN